MNPYQMPTSSFRDDTAHRHDWADGIAARLIGSMADSELAAGLKRDVAAALRAERKASVKLLRSMASMQLDENTQKIVETCANAISNR